MNSTTILCFPSRGQHLCKFIGTKESVYIKKRVQLPQDWFGTQTWPPFHCFGTQIFEYSEPKGLKTAYRRTK